jgi:hypothetical protein
MDSQRGVPAKEQRKEAYEQRRQETTEENSQAQVQ